MSFPPFAPQDEKYTHLADEELELLILAWMEEKLLIPAPACPVVFYMLGGRVEEVGSTDPVLQRARAEELSQNPEALKEGHSLLDKSTSAFLTRHYSQLMEKDTFPVNVLQLHADTGLTSEEMPFFLLHLFILPVLTGITPHTWGAPWDAWVFDEDFLAYFREENEAAFISQASALKEVFMAKHLKDRELAAKFVQYLEERSDEEALPIEEEYEKAAATLGVDLATLIDAERCLLEESPNETTYTITGQVT